METIAVIAQLVSSIVIVITLIYLAIQTKQTNRALFSSSRPATMTADLGLLSSSLDRNDLALYTKSFEEMTDAERIAATNWIAAFLRIREFAWFQYRNGIMDEATWISYISPAKRILHMPGIEPLWLAISQEIDPGFSAEVKHRIG